MMEASKALMSWSLTKARAPQPSTSSPQVAKKTTSPLRGFPLWAWSFRAAAKAQQAGFHVAGAPAIHGAVHNLCPEGIILPVGPFPHRDYIQVAR